MNTKVLFISPDAQPHGARILLLHLVRSFAARAGFFPRILIKWAASRGTGFPGSGRKLHLPASLT
jgi:hypothetical protein